MTIDQRNRMRTLAQDTASLIVELREDRATSTNKALVRGVLRHLEAAHNSLDKAIGRAAEKRTR